MARPIYVICSEDGSEDKPSGLVSIYKIIEKISLTSKVFTDRIADILPTGVIPTLVEPLSMRITAAWIKDDDDNPEDIFEIGLHIIQPSKKETTVFSSDFPCPSDLMPSFRVIARGYLASFIDISGVLIIESRIRKKSDGGAWKTMGYPIIVETGKDDSANAS